LISTTLMPAKPLRAALDPALPIHPTMTATVMDPSPSQAEMQSWQRESERNHHLSGLFLILAGLFILAPNGWRRFALVRYILPICFLASGVFLLVYSDTELWPFGPKAWIAGTVTNLEVLQHKIFALLLLGLGFIELQRARGKLTAAWAAWVFPVVAMAGSLLLLFHKHHPGMHQPNHMAVMARVQSEHLGFAVTGFGIGLSKGLAEVPTRWQTICEKLWPLLMILLGILLMFYTETV
jgi:copper resistance protein D